jgi:hypothetical protein
MQELAMNPSGLIPSCLNILKIINWEPWLYIYKDGVFDFLRTVIMNPKNHFDTREALFLLFCFFLIIAQQQQQHNGLSPPPSRFPKKVLKRS